MNATMPPLLSRYIARRLLASIVFTYVVIFTLLFLVEFIDLLQDAGVGSRVSIIDLVSIGLQCTPLIAEEIFPFTVLFASIVDDPSSAPERFPTETAQEAERQRLFRIIEEMVKWENTTNETVMKAARDEIMRATNGNPPPVLDPFCGGGSIPLEAQRLGLELSHVGLDHGSRGTPLGEQLDGSPWHEGGKRLLCLRAVGETLGQHTKRVRKIGHVGGAGIGLCRPVRRSLGKSKEAQRAVAKRTPSGAVRSNNGSALIAAATCSSISGRAL